MKTPGQSVSVDSSSSNEPTSRSPLFLESLLSSEDLLTDGQILQAMHAVAAREKGITATTLFACVKELMTPSDARLHRLLWEALHGGSLDFAPDSRLVVRVDG